MTSGTCPGVAAPPVATASVSECARSVRPEQLSVLRSTLSKRHQPGASRTFPADEVQKDKIQGRAPHPGKSRLRAAVKAEWARWSACHLSWPSMPIPGVCSLRCCRCPRHAKEQRRAGTLRSLVAKGWKRQHRGTHRAHFNIHVRPRMDFVLSSSKSPRGYRFPQNLPTDVKERSQKMCRSTFFSVSR
ncbi:uncharacterized protein LOC129121053 [Agelaius phoeniceus]|uniref:uncharacterized protein LOC129121053 n=1 Tax=Agelaius phoeniceus TaxID=39638 RepID=UPI0040551BC1